MKKSNVLNFMPIVKDYVKEYVEETYELDNPSILVDKIIKLIESNLDELEDDATIDDCDLYIYEACEDYFSEEKKVENDSTEKKSNKVGYEFKDGKLNVTKSDYTDVDYVDIMDRYHNATNEEDKKRAAEELLVNMENYVKHMVFKKYGTYGEHLEDLLSEARTAIMLHIDEYDARQTKPNTFFTCHIKGVLSHYIHSNKENVSDHYGQAIAKIKKVQPKLAEQGLDENSVSLLHQYTGIRETTIEKALQYILANSGQSFDSFENPDFIDSQISSRNDTPEKAYLKSETKAILDKALEELNELERKCIELYYYEDLDYTKVSKIMNIDINEAKKQVKQGIRILKKSKIINQLQKVSPSAKIERTIVPMGASSDTNSQKCQINIVISPVNSDDEYEEIEEVLFN